MSLEVRSLELPNGVLVACLSVISCILINFSSIFMAPHDFYDASLIAAAVKRGVFAKIV